MVWIFDGLNFKTNLQDADLIHTDESDNKVLLFAMLYAVCCLLCRIFPTVPKQDFGSPVLIARCFSCLFFWQLLSRILNQSVVFHRGFLPQKYRCNIISVLEILTFEPQFVMFYWFVSDCWCQSYFSVNRILFSISSFLFYKRWS